MSFNFSSVSSLASIVNMFAGADPVKAQLVPLNDDGSEMIGYERAFQYFPENINDAKSANYSTRNIPGGSHPIYQFIGGGDRTISFTAIFTSDEDPSPSSLLGALTGALDISLGSLASTVGLTSESNKKKHSTAVESAVIWLRSFLYPRYTAIGTFTPLGTVSPPPVVRIYLPNSNIHGATSNGMLVVDSVDCIMAQCDVVYDTFYRGGSQRITTVHLTFHETIQTGRENWQFADGSALFMAWKAGWVQNGKIKPYVLEGKKQPSKNSNTSNYVSSATGAIGKLASKVGSAVNIGSLV